MGDTEMTMSQVAYNELDQSYPPEFWNAVSQMDRPPTSTQSSCGSETVVDSASNSLTDITGAGGSATLGPMTLKATVSESSHTGNLSKALGTRTVLASACSSGNLSGISGTCLKRSASEAGLPPQKIPKYLACDAVHTRRDTPSRTTSAPAPRIPAEVRPESRGPPSDAFTLKCLFGGNHGQHLESFIVSHSAEVQPEFDNLQIARGVQWELVRGITSGDWTWDDVKLKIHEFKGTHESVAPAVWSIMLGTAPRPFTDHERSLWQELDREAKATVENKSRGLGLMGEFEGIPDYYGGNVQCTIRLLHTADGKEPNIRLEPLQMARSHHLARELGSVSVIALRDNKNGDLVRQWARRKFILCGRTYIALPPKSSKVYLIETTEDYKRSAQEWCGDQYRIPYDVYIHKNNPMALNANQPFAKYLTRLNLYLSTSIPVLEFALENIHFIEDQYADGWSKDQRPPTETVMTDGCGFLNRAAALKISAKLKYKRPPVAYQGRIAGSKGLWVLHPEDESPEPRIWIRDSQKKITLSRMLRAHRIFDLLAVSKPSSSAHLSAQSIIILANNGVHPKVLCALQEQGLEDLITPLMDWDRPSATAYLWNAINDVSNVTRSRLQRLAAGASRALGLEKRGYEDVDMGEDSADVGADLHELSHTGRNFYNGEPLIVPEAAMDLLQAGFDPLKLPFLSFKIHNLIKSVMQSFLARYRIPLATSLEAYIIPDPSGQLQENQVFFKSSRDPDGPLQESVVIGRYPMRESSDMQKVSAVDIPALAQYVDVLVISIHGSRSLASLLAGGDTDGDEAIIIRERTVVDSFENQAFVPPPVDFLAANFERQVQTVTDFGKKLGAMTIAQAQLAFQEEVLIGLRNDKIGVYSLYHDAATYEWGLDDSRTRRIAHMTTTLLDASKTGLRLKKTVEEADQRLIGRIPRTRCFDVVNGQSRVRNSKLGTFVLDSLLAAGNSTKDRLQAKFERSVATHLTENENPPDSDIEEPYHRATRAAVGNTPFAKAMASDLDALRSHINELRIRYGVLNRQLARSKEEQHFPESVKNRKKGPAKQTDNCMLPLMRDFRQPIMNIEYLHSMGNIDEIKASFAFSLGQKFGFAMGFQDICEIKRRAELKRGPFNKVAVIDGAKNMGGSARRLLKHMGDGV